jgi:nucleotide-binding universal stress UspA family protein
MKFMVCYDESDLSKHVVKEAQKHAQVWNAELVIVRAVMREDPIKHSKLLEMENQLESEIKKLFEKVDIPYNVQLEVDDIDVEQRIIKLVEREKVDLVFLGPKKRSKVGKLLFGSTAQYIILHSPCPVVTITRLAKDWN